MEALGSCSSCGQESGWTASRGFGALDLHSGVGSKSRTCARMAGRSSSSENSIKDSPTKVAADRMGEAMEEAFGLKIMKNETTEAFTGRSRLLSTSLQAEGVNLPSEARGYIVWRGCRLGCLGRATIMSATSRSWEFV